MLQAGARICKSLGEEFMPYLGIVMPPLLTSAQLKPDIKMTDAESTDDEDNDEDVSHCSFPCICCAAVCYVQPCMSIVVLVHMDLHVCKGFWIWPCEAAAVCRVFHRTLSDVRLSIAGGNHLLGGQEDLCADQRHGREGHCLQYALLLC